jgi:transcriptional regulator with XRE-family HTH domain
VEDREGERRAETGAFLRAMRGRLRPEDVGLAAVPGRRRTPGLRRQEVAELAAVSIDWYIRLEQGRAGAPGVAVLDGIADALRLSPAERDYLHLIARRETPVPRPGPADPAAGPVPVAASLRAMLAGMPLLPAYVIDHCYQVLAWNEAATALFGADFGTPGRDNSARLLFLDAATRAGQLSWEQIARETVGAIRAALARYRDDARLRALIAELCAGSPEFAAWWDDQTVRERTHGVKRIWHDEVGVLTVTYDFLAVGDGATGSEQRLVVLTPHDPASEAALRTLVVGGAARLLVAG